jgi:hypothetical protein
MSDDSLTRREFFDKYEVGAEGTNTNGRKTFTTTNIGKASYLRYCPGPDCGLARDNVPSF